MTDIKEKELAPPVEFTSDQIQLLTRTIAKGATPDELKLFAMICQRSGLDPFSRQIHCVKRWDGDAGREIATFQTGIDGLRLIADRTGCYAPGREPSFSYNDDGSLLAATSFVKKLVAGTWHEVAATALFAEYAQKRKDGSLTAFWRRMPHSQLAKCSEALALRRCFPMETSGLYTHEEMAQAGEPVSPDTPPLPHADALAAPRNGATVEFRGGRYPTAGITQETFDQVQTLCKRVGKDVAVNLLGPLGLESVLELTEETGREYLAALELAADNITDLPLGTVER